MDQFLLPIALAVISGIVVYLLTKYGIDVLANWKSKKKIKEEISIIANFLSKLSEIRDPDEQEKKINEFKNKWNSFIPEVQKDFYLIIQNITIKYGKSEDPEERVENDDEDI